MWRMAAIFKLQQLRVRYRARDAIDLRHGAVFVIESLNGEQRAGDLWKQRFDIPRPKFRIEPDVIPAPEGGVDIVVIAGELDAQIAVHVDITRLGNACDRYVLNKNMGRRDDGTRDAVGKRRGVYERDGATVAVTKQPWLVVFGGDADGREQCGQYLARLDVHEIRTPLFRVRARCGAAIAGARIHESTVATGNAKLRWEVAPHRD